MKLGARQRAHAGPRQYPAPVPQEPLTNPAGAAIEYLLPPPIGRQEAIDLFDGRASFAAINAWRHAHANMPQWAKHILASKIDARRDPLNYLKDALLKQKART